MKKILIHGLGHKAIRWNKTIEYIENNNEILCPELSSILNGKEANYDNLYSSFVKYCNDIDRKIDLCGLSLGGILALNYALDFPNNVNSLILIGTPHKVPKVMLSIQNVIFKFLPKSVFETMTFNKKDTFVLGNSMKKIDFSTRVSKLKCPTLIICGEKDNANIKSADYLSKHIKNSKLEIIKNTGHIINEENPKELARLINNLWRE